MKKIITLLVVILTTNVAFSQVNYSSVLDLLLNNKRQEARKEFDKQFGKLKSSNIDLLFLDALIDIESGKIYFNDSFLKSIEKLPNAQYYIPPFINDNLVMSDVKEQTFNDLAYQKIDFLASSEKFKNLAIVKYRKAVFESLRYQKDKAINSYKDIAAINQWQYCGVFENMNGSGLNIYYEPESYAKNDKLFDANSNGSVGWYTPIKAQEDPYHFFGNEAEYGNGVIYAQTFIDSPEAKEYVLSFGANKGVKIFLNDKEIYFNQDIKRTNLDAYNIKVKLNKGYNRLLFKLEIGSGNDYFAAQLKNTDFTQVDTVKFSASFQPYEVAKSEVSESELLPLAYEKYFSDLVKNNPDNVLYKFFLYKAYECNFKKAEAFEAIEGLDKKYPKSSFINTMFINYYSLVGDESQKMLEISKNIESNDEKYYLNILNKLVDAEWFKSANIQDIEKYKKIAEQFPEKFYTEMFDFILSGRKGDIDGMFQKIENVYKDSYNDEKIKLVMANLYFKVKKDKDKAVSMLEELYSQKDIYEASNYLIEHYNDLNRKDDVKKIVTNRIAKYPYLNELRNAYVTILISENKYEEALALLNENLSYFPYSFTTMEKKANVLILLKRQKEAENSIRQSLMHNSGNDALRKKLYDISKTPDEIEQVETKNIDIVLKTRRNSKLKSDYGVVILLDEYLVNVFPEGGRKEKVTYLYEITAESGIEEMKEYSLSSDFNILKSEIIKTDGTKVPAEKGENTLVFSNLKVGDAIYISYESYQNAAGRFYKDFNISTYFNSNYPSEESIFSLIHPEGLVYNSNFSNGQIASTTKKINGKTCTTWKRSSVPSLALQESYAPVASDLTNKLTVGTIKSWKDIANWYADLVKKQLKVDKITTQTFNELFPKGLQGITEENKARRIYEYIEKNIKYSSLDFRQSGFVPQKPSKTITTKLGDCKDVSTLFVSLAQLAGLKANLVLVLTNDNGYNSMLLPSSDFNHCIVKTNIDGKEVFLELTDRYLPFKALPSSLFKANALVISFDKNENENTKLINIPFDNAVKNITVTSSVIEIDDKSKKFTNKHSIQGAIKSYFNELFAESTTEDVRKKEFEENLNSKLKKVVALESVKLIENGTFDTNITFETKFSIAENLQKVGSLKITQIPFIDNAYTRDIITAEKRNYDINYVNYESSNEYQSEVVIKIPVGKVFSDIPESKAFNFKGHNYVINYKLADSTSLKVTRSVTIPWTNIATTDYPEYKKFVENVIEAEEQIVGFK